MTGSKMKRINKKILIVCLCFFIINIIVFSGCSNSINFTPEKWRDSSDYDKEKMIDSLLTLYNISEMSSKNIEELLGEPDYTHKINGHAYFTYYYLIGKDNYWGLKWFKIEFKDNKVIDAFLD